MAEGLNQRFAKLPLGKDDIMDYPFFFKQKLHNL